jgi:ribosome-associated translation inhibitor RaiA
MQIQVNTDNATEGREKLIEGVSSVVRERLERYSDRITRVEIHLSDVNGDRGGEDKHCVIEMRPSGMEPVSATAQAASIHQAVTSATDKAITVLDRTFGKLSSRKGH